jgi:SAM-dependent methyltransferase
MSTNQFSDPTLAYYDAHAEEYARQVLPLDMDQFHERFLALVPAGGHILDAGCGPGRDALAFLRRGYRVTAIDASAALARLAAALLGQPVELRRFQDLDYEESFDGIWACASLLHVPRRELDHVFRRFTRALRPGGIWYMSFKWGEAEEIRGGRRFTDFTEPSLRELLAAHPQLAVVEVWQTQDLRTQERVQVWVNAMVRRVVAAAGQAGP